MGVLFFSFTAVVCTAVGGLLALRFRDHLHLILGFTAGVLLGVVSFDILPEIFALSSEHSLDPTNAMIALVVGFLAFHAAEKLILIHHAQEENYAEHHHPQVGLLSALALVSHSFMDGVGIGLGFQVSNTIGVAVAVAVIAHDFADGLNTMSLMLSHNNTTRRALVLLALDALAPMFGALSTLFFQVAPGMLALYLGFFAGFLLYISAADILPEAHSRRRSGLTIVMTVLGTIFIFVVTRFAEG
ncbi:MAG TPA: ZIP family metal transporter [Kouleothrix sp.]|jgi:ZIP family zinc transporter|nr:ZIP family metal transporter [Kouleothrix sp.]